MSHWVNWIIREAKRLRWSFLASWHSWQIHRLHGDRERIKPHFRALILCHSRMDSVMRVNPNA
jgi:hypothetical protein